MSGDGQTTWILTGSLENFRINVERGFDVIGFKERRRQQAEEFEPGDEVFFYVTGVQAFGGIARVSSEMFEDRTPIWPRARREKPEPYPWRVEAEPVLVLAEDDFVPAEELVAGARARPQVAARALASRLPGTAANDRRGRRRAAPGAHRQLERPRPHVTDEGTELVHARHFTREEANALLPQLTALLGQLREAKDELTDDRGPRGALRGRADQRRRRARGGRSESPSSRSGGCSRRSRRRGSCCATSTGDWSTFPR